jgi:hypothetical protein
MGTDWPSVIDRSGYRLSLQLGGSEPGMLKGTAQYVVMRFLPQL